MADGFRWPRTQESTVSEVQCNQASSLFRKETRAVRTCLEGGRWGDPDLTTCTLREGAQPFLLISFILEVDGTDSGSGGGVLTPGFSTDGILDDQTRNLLEVEVGKLIVPT